jgi:putative copper export protein
MTSPQPLRSTITPWLIGCVLVAGVVLTVVLEAAGGAYTRSPGGLPDAGPLTGWGLPVVRLLVDLAGFATVGLTLVGSRVLHVGRGPADDALPFAVRMAAIWAALCVLQSLLYVSETLATPLVTTDLAAVRDLLGALAELPEATAMLAQAALAASVVWLVALARTPTGTGVALAAAVAAFVPPTLFGHAATGNRLLGSLSLVVHVVAAALWVGGLAALTWTALRGRTPLANAVPRYSLLAMGCVAAVALSGVVNAAVRIGSLGALFGSAYGLVVLAKVVAIVTLAAFGQLHRQHTVERLRTWRRKRNVPAAAPVFIGLAAVELTVMAATVALAVGLSRTPTPTAIDALPPGGAVATPRGPAVGAQPASVDA